MASFTAITGSSRKSLQRTGVTISMFGSVRGPSGRNQPRQSSSISGTGFYGN
jgi:hypothetical protein